MSVQQPRATRTPNLAVRKSRQIGRRCFILEPTNIRPLVPMTLQAEPAFRKSTFTALDIIPAIPSVMDSYASNASAVYYADLDAWSTGHSNGPTPFSSPSSLTTSQTSPQAPITPTRSAGGPFSSQQDQRAYRRPIDRRAQNKRSESGRELLLAVKDHISRISPSLASQIRGQADAMRVATSIIRQLDLTFFELLLNNLDQQERIRTLEAAVIRALLDAPEIYIGNEIGPAVDYPNVDFPGDGQSFWTPDGSNTSA
ncbi:hypothetical protein SISNIDRAFT_482992 [Sistotremastrum niveocremeum HHB9708]|uniref:Uncharacterized protein n=1 Tax=Sistotremastrum niveocremeum HHB9708 TaxID=1314777 RepID=A0A164XZ32_9AGAM|nr:hypothetical protein SISNIDRAFT_482992 [Sistotremastrum niveocremeum HHB9708]